MDLQIREIIGKKVKSLRNQGILPATVYGKGVGPFSVQIDDRTFQTIYRQVGRTSLVKLNIPGQPEQSAFIQDVQRHPVTRNILHADLHVVDLKAEMNVEVPVMITGESLLVERGDAVVNAGLSVIEVRGLPANLPHHIEVDISGLDSLDKAIYVSDLASGEDCVFVTPAEEMVVSLTQTRVEEAEEEEEEVEGIALESEPELIRREREEESGEK